MVELSAVSSVAVIGLGKTGCSAIKYLRGLGKKVVAFDERAPLSVEHDDVFIDVDVVFGALSVELLQSFDLVVVSPGVNVSRDVFVTLREIGIPICGDLELFFQQAKAPIIAITGSNGKTTLTNLVNQALVAAGYSAPMVGNIGVAALDLLSQPVVDFYVVELSSFQLETIYSLRDHVAVVINYSPDHLDHYPNFQAYVAAKNRIYNGAKVAIVNVDQADLLPITSAETCCGFSLLQQSDFCLSASKDRHYLTCMNETVCTVDALKQQGSHHYQNALVLLAILKAIQVPLKYAVDTLRIFSGIEHRCQLIRVHAGVSWFNDSKATNEGAAIAAIKSVTAQVQGKLILLAGGDGKGADFKALYQAVSQWVAVVIVYGQDKPRLVDVLRDAAQVMEVDDLPQAVVRAQSIADSSDAVLLSPACASLDMFTDYQQRGDVFCQCVRAL